MDGLGDYRVSDWLDEGLWTRIEDKVQFTKAALTKGAAIMGVAVAATTLWLTEYPTLSTVPVWRSVPEKHAVVSAKVDDLGRSIDAKIASFLSMDYTDLDPMQVARAQRAAEAVATRRRTNG